MDAAAETRRNTLQSKIAMMRRALGASAVVSRDGGYALAVDESQVDALVVLRTGGGGGAATRGGGAQGAADLTATTLAALPWDGLSSRSATPTGPSVHRTRIDEARSTLLEIQFWAHLQLGDLGSVIGELEAAVAAYPYQESLWELLITALYRAGRQGDALATYQRVRRNLADDLGLDPGPAAAGARATDPGAGGAGRRGDLRRGRICRSGTCRPCRPAWSAVSRRWRRCPTLLTRERLVELVGPGGIGKTAVALEVGRRLRSPDGVWLARLETAVTVSDVVDVLVAALTGRAVRRPSSSGSRARSAVVILDNCEHVVDAASALAVRLLDHAPDLRVLCTSQVPLEVDGERLVELAPLSQRGRGRALRSSGPAPHGVGVRRRERARTCAGRWTDCRWRSSSPLPGPAP